MCILYIFPVTLISSTRSDSFSTLLFILFITGNFPVMVYIWVFL